MAYSVKASVISPSRLLGYIVKYARNLRLAEDFILDFGFKAFNGHLRTSLVINPCSDIVGLAF